MKNKKNNIQTVIISLILCLSFMGVLGCSKSITSDNNPLIDGDLKSAILDKMVETITNPSNNITILEPNDDISVVAPLIVEYKGLYYFVAITHRGEILIKEAR